MIYNPFIIIPLASWMVAQLMKLSWSALRGQVDMKYFYASGGMPSAHAAVVCSLATTAAIVDGLDSQIFGLCGILAAIVMYDSFGVRRSSGEQAVAINQIMTAMEGRGGMQPDARLREVLGHKPQEVAVGAVLGVLLATLFNYDKLGWLWNFLTEQPSRLEHWVYLVGFGLVLALGLVGRVFVARRFKRSPARQELIKAIFVMSQAVGWLGLLAAFGQYENTPYLAWRVTAWLVVAILLGWVSALGWRFRQLPQAVAAEAELARRSKWLPLGKRKAKKRK